MDVNLTNLCPGGKHYLCLLRLFAVCLSPFWVDIPEGRCVIKERGLFGWNNQIALYQHPDEGPWLCHNMTDKQKGVGTNRWGGLTLWQPTLVRTKPLPWDLTHFHEKPFISSWGRAPITTSTLPLLGPSFQHMNLWRTNHVHTIASHKHLGDLSWHTNWYQMPRDTMDIVSQYCKEQITRPILHLPSFQW